MTNDILPSSRNLVIALVEDHPKAILLLRTARKRAQERGCRWRALFIQSPSYTKLIDEERMLRLLTAAEQMGGESEHIEAASIQKGLAQFLAREPGRVELLVLGNAESRKSFFIFNVASWMRLVQTASKYTQVEIVPLSGPLHRPAFLESVQWRSLNPMRFVYAIAAVAAATLCALAIKQVLPPALFRINEHNISLIFMTACAFIAGRYGLLPGLVAALTGFLTMNYYFTIPYNVLKYDTLTDLFSMGIFLSAALLVSLFTSQTRDNAESANKRELSTQLLFTLYRTASESFTRQQAIEKLQRRLERMLEVHVAFFLPHVLNPDRIELAAPVELVLGESDQKSLEACWREVKITGIGAPYNPGSLWRFEPMISSSGEIGIIAVRPREGKKFDAWFGRLLTALANQTANVLEHIDLERSMEETRLREEREKLRSMLLSSVSHDLKTPLAGIIGALSVHQTLGSRLTPEKRNQLLESSLEEAQRLDSFINNILDMTRLESGNIKFKQEWHSASTMVQEVCKRLRIRFRHHPLTIHPIDEKLEVWADIVMTQQVMQNIIDNACKYTPEGTAIEISCAASAEKGFTCTVRDHGGGLPADKITQAFDKYARLQKQDSQMAGTGLGLAICKAVMEAQHGWVTAENHPDGGALFIFQLPQWRIAQANMEGEKHASNQ